MQLELRNRDDSERSFQKSKFDELAQKGRRLLLRDKPIIVTTKSEADLKRALKRFFMFRVPLLLSIYIENTRSEETYNQTKFSKIGLIRKERIEDDLKYKQQQIVSSVVGYLEREMESTIMTLIEDLTTPEFFLKFFKLMILDDDEKRRKFVQWLYDIECMIRKEMEFDYEEFVRNRRSEQTNIMRALEKLTCIYGVAPTIELASIFDGQGMIPEEISNLTLDDDGGDKPVFATRKIRIK